MYELPFTSAKLTCVAFCSSAVATWVTDLVRAHAGVEAQFTAGVDDADADFHACSLKFGGLAQLYPARLGPDRPTAVVSP